MFSVVRDWVNKIEHNYTTGPGTTIEKIEKTGFRCNAVNFIHETISCEIDIYDADWNITQHYNILHGENDSFYFLTSSSKNNTINLATLQFDNLLTGYKYITGYCATFDVLFLLTEDNGIFTYPTDGSESIRLRINGPEGREIKPVWLFFTWDCKLYLNVDGIIMFSDNNKPCDKLLEMNDNKTRVNKIVCSGSVLYFTDMCGLLYEIKDYDDEVKIGRWNIKQIKKNGMKPISHISLSDTHLLALSECDGKLYGIGDNSKNQINSGKIKKYNYITPVTIIDETEATIKVKNIHTRDYCSYVVDVAGRLFCFGHNLGSKLGYSKTVISVMRPTIHPISVNSNIDHVYGTFMTFVVHNDGSVTIFSNINESGIYKLSNFRNKLADSNLPLIKNANKVC